MDEERSVPVSVTKVRALGYSADSKDLVLSLTTKYSEAERFYSVPLECFSDLILDLRRLSGSGGTGFSSIRMEELASGRIRFECFYFSNLCQLLAQTVNAVA